MINNIQCYFGSSKFYKDWGMIHSCCLLYLRKVGNQNIVLDIDHFSKNIQIHMLYKCFLPSKLGKDLHRLNKNKLMLGYKFQKDIEGSKSFHKHRSLSHKTQHRKLIVGNMDQHRSSNRLQIYKNHNKILDKFNEKKVNL